MRMISIAFFFVTASLNSFAGENQKIDRLPLPTDTREEMVESAAYQQLRIDYATVRVARVAASLKFSEIFNPESRTRIDATAQRLDSARLQELAETKMPDLPLVLKKAVSEAVNANNAQVMRITANNFDVVYFYIGDLQNLLVEIDPEFNRALGVILDLNQINGIDGDFAPEALVSFGGTQLSDSGPYCIGCFIPFVSCSGCPTDGDVAFDDFDLDDRLIQTLGVDERFFIPLNSFPLQAGLGCNI